jgi:hypothetical protein
MTAVKGLKDGSVTSDPRLDRVPEHDARSRSWDVRALMAAPTILPPLRSFTWPNRFVSDQGREGACVGHGHMGRSINAPIRSAAKGTTDNDVSAMSHRVYKEAQHVDEWPGEDYDGTSVLAGAKVMARDGLYESYWWAFNIDSVLLAIAYVGPVVLGIPWLDTMFEPRPSGLLDCTGDIAGGHCIRARGVRLRARLYKEGLDPIEVVRLTNSWGRSYGINGDAYIKLDDLAMLLEDEGDACVPVEPGQTRSQPGDAPRIPLLLPNLDIRS